MSKHVRAHNLYSMSNTVARLSRACAKFGSRTSNETSQNLAPRVARLLGVSPSSAYELMHASDFPSLRIGNRIVVPKEKFIEWVERNTGGSSSATGSHESRASANGTTGGHH